MFCSLDGESKLKCALCKSGEDLSFKKVLQCTVLQNRVSGITETSVFILTASIFYHMLPCTALSWNVMLFTPAFPSSLTQALTLRLVPTLK